MKRVFVSLLTLLMLLSSIAPLVSAEIDLYEYNDTTSTNYGIQNDDTFLAQTFTLGTVGSNEDFDCTNVSLLLYRAGTPGTVYACLFETNETGYPTGSELGNASRNGDSFTTSTSGDWYYFTYSTPVPLSASTTYAIVTKTTGSTGGSDCLRHRISTENPYAGGQFFYSVNGGSTWGVQSGYDIGFRVYGEETQTVFTFGYTGEASSLFISDGGGGYTIRGAYAQMGGVEGWAQNITIKTHTIGENIGVQCAIYNYTDYSSAYAGNLIGTTETKTVLGTQDNTVITFEFASPVHLSASTNYYLMVRETTTSGWDNYIKASEVSSRGVYKSGAGVQSFADPLTGESVSGLVPYIYCTYTTIAPYTGPDYYVNGTSGSDTAGNGSILAPFQTIQKAINVSTNGDTIYIMAGTYTPPEGQSGQNVITGKDDSDDWLTIRNYNDDLVIIDGSSSPYVAGGGSYVDGVIEITNSKYIRITGLTVNHSRQGGITVNSGTTKSHIRIDNCSITNCASFAVKAFSPDNLTVEHNYMYNNHNNWSATTPGQELVSIENPTDFDISNNSLMNNNHINIDIKGGGNRGTICHNQINTTGVEVVVSGASFYGGSGVYLDCQGVAVIKNVSIYNNLIYGNNTGIAINNELSGGHYEHIYIYNNILNMTNLTGGPANPDYQIGRFPLLITNSGLSSALFHDIYVYNNVICSGEDNENSPVVLGHAVNTQFTSANLQDVHIVNNVVVYTSATQYAMSMRKINIDAPGVFTINNNSFYRTSGTIYIYWNATGYTSGGNPEKFGYEPVFTNPLFTIGTESDFHLTEGSPCIDTGNDTLAPATDFDGVSRPAGSGIDIGAYEYEAPGDAPVVETLPATGVGSYNATLNGNATNASSAGFEYGLTTSYGTTIGLEDSNYSLSFTTGWTDDVILPVDLWLYNKSLSIDSSPEAFCEAGGILDTIHAIILYDMSTGLYDYWMPDFGGGLTIIEPGKNYSFNMDAIDTLLFIFDNTTENITGNYSNEISPLTPGTLYHYRAVANNTNGTSYGDDATFITKPIAPASPTATANNSTTIYMTWTKGTGANRTVIIINEEDYPANPTDGTEIYNNTLAAYTYTTATPGTRYYYTLFSLSIWGASLTWADDNATGVILTKPDPPVNLTLQTPSTAYVALNWTKDASGNYTYIVRKKNSEPATRTDGTEVYNGTGLTYNDYNTTPLSNYYYKAYHYTTWGALGAWSLTGTGGNITTLDITPPTVTIQAEANTTLIGIPQGWVNITLSGASPGNIDLNTSINNGTYWFNETILNPGASDNHYFNLDPDGVNTISVKATDSGGGIQWINTTLIAYYVNASFYNEQNGTAYSWTRATTQGGLIHANLTIPDINLTIDLMDTTPGYFAIATDESYTIIISLTFNKTTSIVHRIFNTALLENGSRIGLPENQTSFSQQLIYSTQVKPLVVINSQTNTTIAADYTDKVYESYYASYIITIDMLYYLYTIEDGQRVLLASIYGGQANTINLDFLTYDNPNVNLSLITDEFSILPYSNSTILLYYLNLNNDNSQVDFTIECNDTVLFNYIEAVTPDEIAIYFNWASLDLLAEWLYINVTVTKTSGATKTINRLLHLNPDGDGAYEVPSSPAIPSAIAAAFALMIALFGLTMASREHVFGVFGLIIQLIALAVTALADQSEWYIRFVQAIIIILLMFTFLVFKEEGARVV